MRTALLVGGTLAVIAAAGFLAVVLLPRNDEPESAGSTFVATHTIPPSARVEEPYDTQDVRAAFASRGITLSAHRSDKKGCPQLDPSSSSPLRVKMDAVSRVACLRFVWNDGKFVVDNRRSAPEFPHVWAEPRGRDLRWSIMIYGNSDYAKGPTGESESATQKNRFTDQLVRYERAENVLVAYLNAADAARIRDILDQL